MRSYGRKFSSIPLKKNTQKFLRNHVSSCDLLLQGNGANKWPSSSDQDSCCCLRSPSGDHRQHETGPTRRKSHVDCYAAWRDAEFRAACIASITGRFGAIRGKSIKLNNRAFKFYGQYFTYFKSIILTSQLVASLEIGYNMHARNPLHMSNIRLQFCGTAPATTNARYPSTLVSNMCGISIGKNRPFA